MLVTFTDNRAVYHPDMGQPKTIRLGKTETKHNHPVVFGRREPGCPRCEELDAGAPKRKGWGWRRKEEERRRTRAIQNHDCKRDGCGPVCTFGDW